MDETSVGVEFEPKATHRLVHFATDFGAKRVVVSSVYQLFEGDSFQLCVLRRELSERQKVIYRFEFHFAEVGRHNVEVGVVVVKCEGDAFIKGMLDGWCACEKAGKGVSMVVVGAFLVLNDEVESL